MFTIEAISSDVLIRIWPSTHQIGSPIKWLWSHQRKSIFFWRVALFPISSKYCIVGINYTYLAYISCYILIRIRPETFKINSPGSWLLIDGKSHCCCHLKLIYSWYFIIIIRYYHNIAAAPVISHGILLISHSILFRIHSPIILKVIYQRDLRIFFFFAKKNK